MLERSVLTLRQRWIAGPDENEGNATKARVDRPAEVIGRARTGPVKMNTSGQMPERRSMSAGGGFAARLKELDEYTRARRRTMVTKGSSA